MPPQTAQTGYILFLPSAGSVSIPYWQVADGAIIARGNAQLDGDPIFPAESADETILALIPAADAMVSWSAVGELSPKQAETAARIEARQQSLGQQAELHVVAVTAPGAENADGVAIGEGQILTARMSASALKTGLEILAAHGCDPDILLPVGLAIPSPDTGFLRAAIGAEHIIRGPVLVLPDEPALVSAIIGESPIADLGGAQVEAALLAAFASPAINMRVGDFAKRRARSGITTRQWKILCALLGAGFEAVGRWQEPAGDCHAVRRGALAPPPGVLGGLAVARLEARFAAAALPLAYARAVCPCPCPCRHRQARRLAPG